MSATEQPTTIIINITGSGITGTILRQWDAHSCAGGNCPVPTTFEVNDVPRGSARLFQVLVVYNNGSLFRYGDTTKDLSSAIESVDVTVNAIGSSTTEGHVTGRWMDGSAFGGPSGMLEARFQPPGTSPPMTVMRNPIFAGWFNIFLLDTANFTYLLNGQPIFQNVNLFSSDFNASSKVLRVHVPAYDRNNGGTPSSEKSKKLILGYFGPGASTQTVCYDSQSTVISGATLSPGTSPLTYSASGSSASVVHPEGGGTSYYPPAPTGVCAGTASQFIDHLTFYQANLKNGGDSVAGFRGPWMMNSDGSWINATISGTNAALSWKLMPDTTQGSQGIAAITAMIRPNSMSGEDYYVDGGVACSRLEKIGFKAFGADFLTTPGVSNGSMTLTGLPANSKIILCPSVNVAGSKVYLDAGAEVWSSSGGGSSLSWTLQLAHAGSTTDDTVSHNFASIDNTQQVSSCKQYVVNLMDSYGTAQSDIVPINVTFSNFSGGLALYNDAACSSSLSTLVIGANTSSASLYVKSAPTSSSGGFQLNASLSGGSATGMVELFTVGTSSSALNLSAQIVGRGSALVQGQCYPFKLSITDGGGQPYYLTSGSSPANFTTGGGTIHTSSDCSAGSQISSYVIPAFTAGVQLYYKPGASSPVTVGASTPSISNSYPAPSTPVDAPGTAVPTVLLTKSSVGSTMLSSGNLWSYPGCSKVGISYATTNLGLIDPDSIGSASLSISASGGGTFYTDSSCSANATTSLSWSYPYQATSYWFSNGTSSSAVTTVNSSPKTMFFLPQSVVVQASGTSVFNGTDGGVGVVISFRDDKNRPYYMPTAGSVNLASAGTTSNLLVMANAASSCSGGSYSTSVTVAVGDTMSVAFACSNSTVFGGSLSANFLGLVSSNNFSISGGGSPGTIVGTKMIAGALASGTQPMALGACEKVVSFPVDSYGHWLTSYSSATTSLQINGLTAAGDANMYTDPTCSTVLASGNSSPTSAGVPGASSYTPALLYFKGISTSGAPLITHVLDGNSGTLPLSVFNP